MRERPILFSGPMVRAILEGRKTQTRRVVKFQFDQNPGDYASVYPDGSGRGFIAWAPMAVSAEETARQYPGEEGFPCPFGVPGDRLWVRETFSPFMSSNRPSTISEATYSVLKDGAHTYRNGRPPMPGLDSYAQGAFDHIVWRPSIFMPRWASRLTLEVKAVRVERLQEISREDAAAEGVCWAAEQSPAPSWVTPSNWPEQNFAQLWDSINAKRGHSWASDPWVWVVEFEKVGP